MIDLVGRRPHYLDHLRPVWDALPSSVRGRIVARNERAGGLCLVASAVDARRVAQRPYVYLEHGAGQAYLVENESYSGGPGHDRCVLFLCPNWTVAGRWKMRYPDTPAVVVGTPMLDPWHRTITRDGVGPAPGRTGAVVAFTWHWDCTLVPETRSALPHYRRHLSSVVDQLRRAGVEVIGHGHPRAWRYLRDLWASLGVEPVEHFDLVIDRADLLVADNSSALYEFASLDRPVVALNAPWYRRDVEHGLRFWTLVPGLQVDDPADLGASILHSLEDPWPDMRRQVVDAVYPLRDGRAADRAARAIVEVIRAEPEGAASVDPS